MSSAINVYIIKDFSRLGRNYIDMGELLEQLFPILGVRLIAVNDHYDSDDVKYQTGDFEIARKNLVNYFYSIDTSRKIKTANQILMEQGKRFYGARVNYGYYIDPVHKRDLLVDPEAADIVKRIFELYLDRYSIKEIAVILNSENIPSPGEYKKLKNPKLHFSDRHRNGEKLFWNHENLSYILRDEGYTGVYFAGKTKLVSVGSTKVIKLPKDQWIRVENHHEAIISKEMFEQVQAKLNKRRKPASYTEVSSKVLGGKVICGVCHKALKSTGKNECYYCRTPQYMEDAKCTRDRILVKKVEQLVLDAINSLIVYCSDKDSFKKLLGDVPTQIKEYSSKLAAEQKRERRLRARVLTLYEQWKDGKINQNVFLKQKSDVEKDIVLVLDEMEALKKKIDELKLEQEQSMNLSSVIQKYEKSKLLTREMAEAFIKEVTVFDSKHIEIKWNFSSLPISVKEIGV